MKEPAKVASRVISCPRCRKSVRYDPKNPFRPFCSALCKNEDIVAWAEEGYKLPAEPADPDEAPLPTAPETDDPNE